MSEERARIICIYNILITRVYKNRLIDLKKKLRHLPTRHLPTYLIYQITITRVIVGIHPCVKQRIVIYFIIILTSAYIIFYMRVPIYDDCDRDRDAGVTP